MNQFEYVRSSSQQHAISTKAQQGAAFIAGGTNLIDLMKRGVTSPGKLIDINGLPLKGISFDTKNGLQIGALALNSDVSENELVLKHQPLLSLALKAGASPQLRNMATVGGNMLQRTRCTYFYDTTMPCNKRSPGSGCGALQGYNRMHAIFGASDTCIAVHPSDMCVALVALDAVVEVAGPKGKRKILFADFHRLPGNDPAKDNTLGNGELILGITIPANDFSKNVHYLKVRDRASYAFALVSVAAALRLENNTINSARLAMGGVAHKPWRLYEAEKFLVGKIASVETFTRASAIAMIDARAYKYNSFKLKLAPASIIEALQVAASI